jgi:peptidoglycan/LPS O-acetylase OafA/YrhL
LGYLRGQFFQNNMSQTSSGRVPALDGVRGIATLAVVISHFQLEHLFEHEWWWKMGHCGWIGVDLFFVLSGFLITGILMSQKTKPNYFYNFYRRRALRILPLYYFSILLCILAVIFIEKQPEKLWVGWDGMQWFLLFIPNVAMGLKGEWLYQTTWVGMSHLWSLAVEEQFYFVWPLVVWFLPQKHLKWVSAVIMLSGGPMRYLTDWCMGMEWSMASYVMPWCRMEGLAAGSFMAVLHREGKFTFTGWQRVLVRDLAFVAGFVALYMIVLEDNHFRGTFVTIAFSSFLYLSLTAGGISSTLSNNAVLRHIGLFSYALYVFHQMFREVFKWYYQEPLEQYFSHPWLIQVLYMILAGATTYAITRLSWWALEKPFLDLK